MGAEPQSQQSNRLLTVEELSQELQVPIATVYFWVHRGDVPYIKVGRHLRFERDAVVRAFKQKTEDRHPACRLPVSLVEMEALYGRTSSRRSLKKKRDWNLAETKKGVSNGNPKAQ